MSESRKTLISSPSCPTETSMIGLVARLGSIVSSCIRFIFRYSLREEASSPRDQYAAVNAVIHCSVTLQDSYPRATWVAGCNVQVCCSKRKHLLPERLLGNAGFMCFTFTSLLSCIALKSEPSTLCLPIEIIITKLISRTLPEGSTGPPEEAPERPTYRLVFTQMGSESND